MNTWKVENPARLLNAVKNKFSDHYTTKDLRWSIEHNRCFVNNCVERFASAPVQKGDSISIFVEKQPHFVKEEARILFEDSHILVYNKPPFLTSENLEKITHSLLVHRLDRDTSGVILLAKTPAVQHNLEKQFRKRTIKKEYLAWVAGVTQKESGVICGKMAPLKRREGAVIWGMSATGVLSKTVWKTVHRTNRCSLLHCAPLTGRTHQLRVHLQHIGHPIIGDFTYGSPFKKESIFRPLLHALSLAFIHPITQETLALRAPLPADFNLSD